MDDLVDQRLLMLEASKKKMFASDDVIRRTIASIDAFNVDGKFSASVTRPHCVLRA
jgi:peptidyl-prolyl cis-trans isomerase D